MSVIFDVKDYRGSIISTLIINDDSLTEFGKIYDNSYFQGLEETFGSVSMECRDENKNVVIFKQRYSND